MRYLSLILFFLWLLNPALGASLYTQESITAMADDWFDRENYEEIEHFLSSLKKNDRTSDGWPLYSFFLEEFIPSGPPKWIDLDKMDRLLRAWSAQYGETQAWLLIRAHWDYAKGYKLIRLSKDHNREARTEEAEQHFSSALRTLTQIDHNVYQAACLKLHGRIATSRGENLANWFMEVRSRYPSDPSFITSWIGLEPRFGTSVFDEIATRKISERINSILYVQVLTRMALLHDRDLEEDDFFNWDITFEGLTALNEDYPCPLNKDRLRFFVCLYEDDELAAELFRDGARYPITPLWAKSEFPFEDWRAWALGEETLPLVENLESIKGVWKRIYTFGVYPRYRSEVYYETHNSYIAIHAGEFQYIMISPDKHWNHSRPVKLESAGILAEQNMKNKLWWEKTIFTENRVLIIQHLSTTDYYQYIGSLEDILPGLEARYKTENKE